MKRVMIKEKLKEIEFDLDSISLGDFDIIGEYTAKKNRDRNSEYYRKVGCFFRPNYERGILIYALITKYNITSFLEIGFGRGYSTFCAAKAMHDKGIDGTITTVDPALDKEFLENLSKVFPQEWFHKIKFIKSPSQDFYKSNNENFDLVYIDGDHRYDAVKNDWENTKNRYLKFLIFDDYTSEDNKKVDIECTEVIDEIADDTKELIITDRRIFVDDRGIKDEDLHEGQVILTNKAFKEKISEECDW